MKLSSILLTFTTAVLAIAAQQHLVAAIEVEDETTSHSMVRSSSSSSSTSSNSRPRRELLLGLRFQDYCVQDSNGRHRTVRLRPMFRRSNSGGTIVKRGKCNTCPCNNGPNFECQASTNLCVCKKGYRLNVASTECVDIDECKESTLSLPACSIAGTCINTPGNYTCGACPCNALNQVCQSSTNTCVCRTGLEFNAAGTCVDIDECSRNATDACPRTARCQNTVGSYFCQSCSPGFEVNAIGSTCVDVDECSRNATGVCPLSTSRCKNTAGSFRCETCNRGFEFNATGDCVDIDECSRNATGLCPLSTSRCKNTAGSFRCETCAAGFEFNATGGCVDIDECSRNATVCGSSTGFTCNNTIGSYTCTACPCANCAASDTSTSCTCAPGFFRPFNATSNTTNTSVPVVLPFLNASNTCADVDECVLNRTICGSGQSCTNVFGGYNCTTNTGGGGGLGIFTIFCFIPPFFLFCL